MTVASRGLLVFALAAGVTLAAPAGARAAETEVDAEESGPLRKEWVGLELTPVSYATSRPPQDGRGDGSFSALQGGPGAILRFGRYRFEHGYITPFMVGLYVAGEGKVIFAHTQVEGGVIVPGTDRRLELGVGLGFGILAMSYGTGCDGSCDIGGSGPLAALAARFLVWTAPTFTAGIALRASMPIGETRGESFGYFTGHSSVVMGGLEVAYGRP
jgi:hypothetical protein